MIPYQIIVGACIASMRRMHGLSQKDVAPACTGGKGVVQSTYARYERGVSTLSVVDLSEILKIIKISMSDFFLFVERAERIMQAYEVEWKSTSHSLPYFELMLIRGNLLPSDMPPFPGRQRVMELPKPQ